MKDTWRGDPYVHITKAQVAFELIPKMSDVELKHAITNIKDSVEIDNKDRVNLHDTGLREELEQRLKNALYQLTYNTDSQRYWTIRRLVCDAVMDKSKVPKPIRRDKPASFHRGNGRGSHSRTLTSRSPPLPHTLSSRYPSRPERPSAKNEPAVIPTNPSASEKPIPSNFSHRAPRYPPHSQGNASPRPHRSESFSSNSRRNDSRYSSLRNPKTPTSNPDSPSAVHHDSLSTPSASRPFSHSLFETKARRYPNSSPEQLPSHASSPAAPTPNPRTEPSYRPNHSRALQANRHAKSFVPKTKDQPSKEHHRRACCKNHGKVTSCCAAAIPIIPKKIKVNSSTDPRASIPVVMAANRAPNVPAAYKLNQRPRPPSTPALPSNPAPHGMVTASDQSKNIPPSSAHDPIHVPKTASIPGTPEAIPGNEANSPVSPISLPDECSSISLVDTSPASVIFPSQSALQLETPAVTTLSTARSSVCNDITSPLARSVEGDIGEVQDVNGDLNAVERNETETANTMEEQGVVVELEAEEVVVEEEVQAEEEEESGKGMENNAEAEPIADATCPSLYKPTPKSLGEFNFAPHPFFIVLERISQPKLIPDAMEFTLTSDHIRMLKMNISSPCKLLLFCAMAKASLGKDRRVEVGFPSFGDVYVNGINIKANLRPAGTSRLPDLTSHCTLVEERSNFVVLSAPFKKNSHVAIVQLVQMRSHEYILDWIKSQKTLTKQEVLKKIRARAEDPDIMATSSTVSLRCPIGYTPIQIPLRTPTCKHIQCFDGYSFLSLHARKPLHSWRCPLCGSEATLWDLLHDGFFTSILCNVPPETENVIVEADGKWRIETEADRLGQKRKKSHPEVVICLDDDEIELSREKKPRLSDSESERSSTDEVAARITIYVD
ncbi:uncharacterized protein VTP21DRAFT_3819 [Calcarisporiella thermophila]|uniref:uncharacterized protein n=1 Tax=Calcarisporiella thermophila TaxID=911321 RepID=UPI003743C608